MTLEELDLGVSKSGMDAYKDALQAKLLQGAADKIDELYQAISGVVDTGWVGTSKVRFMKQLETICTDIKTDLAAEYEDLSARLDEVVAFYVNEDTAIISED